MVESFGARMRQRREEQQIALITIAEQTKIKLSLLEALERDDVSLWPSGIFRRAFIRAYAHAIGLDPDLVVKEFLEVHPEPAEVVDPVSAVAFKADDSRINGGPPMRLRYIVGSAIGSLARLRRGPAVDGLAGGAPISVASEFELPSAARRVETPNEGAVERAPVNVTPAAPEPTVRVQAPREAAQVDGANAAVSDGAPEPEKDPPSSDPDFLTVAQWCTEFGRVETTADVQLLLQEAARILDAIGLIVWVWDTMAGELRPALVHGYSDKVLAQLPAVRRDADNATAAAFRSAQTCAIEGSPRTSGALVVPLLTPTGCAGVLAIELQHGGEQKRSIRAVAMIFAALLAQLMGTAEPAEVQRQLR